MVEHDMGVVFGLADHIAVLVYGEIIASDTPDADPRQRRACRRPISAMLATQLHGRDARGRTTCTPTTARATSCTASTFDVGEGEIVSLLGRNGVGPLDHREGDHGPGAAARARSGFKGRAHRRPEALPDRAPGHRLRAREPRHLPDAHGARRTCCSARRRGKKARAGRSTTCTGCSRGSKERRARRAGVLSGGEQQMLTHVPHADGRSRPDHDRRADRGAGAEDRRAGRRACSSRSPRAASRSCWSSRS